MAFASTCIETDKEKHDVPFKPRLRVRLPEEINNDLLLRQSCAENDKDKSDILPKPRLRVLTPEEINRKYIQETKNLKRKEKRIKKYQELQILNSKTKNSQETSKKENRRDVGLQPKNNDLQEIPNKRYANDINFNLNYMKKIDGLSKDGLNKYTVDLLHEITEDELNIAAAVIENNCPNKYAI